MHSSTTSALLVTSLISVASAFVPMQIAPLPTALDSSIWKPFTTIPAEPAPTAGSPSSAPTPAPTQGPEEIMHILPVLDPNMVPDLKKRQGVSQAIAPTAITQVSPITTYQINLIRSGVNSQLNIVYTQTFNPIPDQWPSPTEAGTIGLGTIQGEIGVVKTKRSLPTQALLGNSADSTPTENAPVSSSIPLLDKLRKAGQEIEEEIEELLNKMKIPGTHKEEDLSVPLGKEVRLPNTGSSDVKEPFNFAESEEDDDDATPLLPELRVHESDARILKAGSLAVLAITIGTLCANCL
ncbi:uncharacterized protein A1O9_08182 [Exophiala aquamarina CBS 119918]|uniref:Uncharacterized protein n=1 Tax=Exophiala aquamarina CBS 119918 TaxID=1182545 RepID=A0A072P6S4_9EURO|nr:uncharacterized protein A1O9_08182 [Exophiala aquamarina CBS 119918]KEF55432.1 hypothetical protein A1O9_08182 [Exophiala aquamarina CBS 119918]